MGLVIIPAAVGLMLIGGVICALMFRAIAREFRREQEVREALRESEARLRAIFNSEPECVKLLDEHCGLIEMNPAGLAMVEAETAEQVVGKNTLDLVAPEYRDHFRETVAEAFAGRATRQEFEVIGLRGTRRWMEQYAVPLWDEGAPRRVKQMLAVTRDISYRKRAEDELKRSRQRFQDLFEFAPEAILMTDREGVIVLANRRVEVLFGWKREELLGQKVERLVPDDLGPRHEELRRRYIQSSVPQSRESARPNLQARRRDGSVFPVEITLSPMESEEGTVVAAAIRDITERVEYEKRTLRTQRLQSIGTLAGGIAHDLNNTLAPIRLSVEMLRLRFPASATEYLDLIETAAKRGGEMTRQLLTFARGSAGERVPVDPTRVLNEIDRILVSTFPKSLRLETKYGKDLAWVSGDATQVHQLLLNLCVNARDAMDHGGTLTVEATNFHADAAFAALVSEARPGAYLVLRVRDTGTGIPPAILDRIFDPFFTTKGPEKGTGLGLATALGIAKGHGGFLRVNSVVGQGSTFEVYLPALARGEAAPDRPEMAEWRGVGELVLVVDDEPPIRDVLQRMLEELNCAVLTAAHGADALIRFGEHLGAVKLVLTDLSMPVRDGLNLVQSLRQIAPDLAIITMTGLKDENRVARLKELGVEQNLTKPFTKDDLLEALRRVLPRPRS